MNHSTAEHLSQNLILRAIDDELTAAERSGCESHLAVCDVCCAQLSSLRAFSVEMELAVNTTAVPVSEGGARQRLQRSIEARPAYGPLLQTPTKVMRRFGWGMGIAAALAFGILLTPRHETTLPVPAPERASPVVSPPAPGSVEVDGETFLPVPYSNAELATVSPQIVQMQVPVSSLAEIGIVFEPLANRMNAGPDSERSVLTDVLVGADGQPLGVHVLEFD